MNVPEELRYSTDHEWARLEEGTGPGRASRTTPRTRLGDIVFVVCPRGRVAVEAGGLVGEVESTKSVSEIYAPVAGEVVARQRRRCRTRPRG